MVTTNTLNRKINDLKDTLLKKEKAILKKFKKDTVVSTEYFIKQSNDMRKMYEKQSKDMRKMYEQHVDDNLVKYILKPVFWIDITLKAITTAFITYLSYKGMNHSQFTNVKVLSWKEEKELEENRGLNVKTWSNKIKNNPTYKSVSLTNDGNEYGSRDNKTYIVSHSSVWLILLDVFVQIFMRIIFSVVIRAGIIGFFNQFDLFDDDGSTKAWDAVVLVSGIIVTYSSEELTDKINLLYGYISIRN